MPKVDRDPRHTVTDAYGHVTTTIEPITGCPRHPKYQVKRPPRGDCRVCSALWKGEQLRRTKR